MDVIIIVALPSCLSNFRAVGKTSRDILRKPSVRLVNRGTQSESLVRTIYSFNWFRNRAIAKIEWYQAITVHWLPFGIIDGDNIAKQLVWQTTLGIRIMGKVGRKFRALRFFVGIPKYSDALGQSALIISPMSFKILTRQEASWLYIGLPARCVPKHLIWVKPGSQCDMGR